MTCSRSPAPARGRRRRRRGRAKPRGPPGRTPTRGSTSRSTRTSTSPSSRSRRRAPWARCPPCSPRLRRRRICSWRRGRSRRSASPRVSRTRTKRRRPRRRRTPARAARAVRAARARARAPRRGRAPSSSRLTATRSSWSSRLPTSNRTARVYRSEFLLRIRRRRRFITLSSSRREPLRVLALVETTSPLAATRRTPLVPARPGQQVVRRILPPHQILRVPRPSPRHPQPHVESVGDPSQQHAHPRDHHHLQRRHPNRIPRLHLIDELLQVQTSGDVRGVPVVPEDAQPVRDVDVVVSALASEPLGGRGPQQPRHLGLVLG
mmetsp:Transcript_14537/g.63003  ORF Transcript_14537/g.63003 Transcript_14537/m.63003 type:complete len:321 (-) Transcript_14537:990-1952(-)